MFNNHCLFIYLFIYLFVSSAKALIENEEKKRNTHTYYPLINVPTCVTDNSSTIIDHIVTNDYTHNILPGVIKTDLTDHYPIFCTISNLTLKKSHKPTFRRDFSMFNADDFCNHLNNEINSFFLTISYINGNNFDAIFDHFLQLLTNAITLYAPMRKLTRKQQKLINKPWISRGILKSIKTKQKLYLSHFVNGNLEQKQLYKKYANKLTKVKFAAKKLYYQDKLETSKNNTAEVWRIIKSLLSSSRSDANLPQKLRHNNQARSQKFAKGGAVWGVWGRSPQPPEANGGLGAEPPAAGGWGLGAKPPAAGGTGVWGWSPQRSKILHFFAKITLF